MGRFFARLPAAALIGAALALGAVPASAHEAHRKGAAAPPPLPLDKLFGGPFDLIDHTGVRRTDRDYRGQYMLIFFGYTNCPAICPTDLQHMAAGLDLLGPEAARIQPLFITTDPARDTPDVLKAYMANFGPRFVGLTGSEAAVRQAARAYRVHRRKVVVDGEDGEDGYLVDHSSLTVLIGPDGKFLTLFPHDTDGAAMAKRLRTYLAAPQS